MRPPKAILETVLYATDLDAAERFYRDVVGLEVVKTFKNQFVFLRCGEQMLLIFDPETSRVAEGGNPIPRHGTTGSGHVCFRAEDKAEVDAWRDHFVAKGLERSTSISVGTTAPIPFTSATQPVTPSRSRK